MQIDEVRETMPGASAWSGYAGERAETGYEGISHVAAGSHFCLLVHSKKVGRSLKNHRAAWKRMK